MHRRLQLTLYADFATDRGTETKTNRGMPVPTWYFGTFFETVLPQETYYDRVIIPHPGIRPSTGSWPSAASSYRGDPRAFRSPQPNSVEVVPSARSWFT